MAIPKISDPASERGFSFLQPRVAPEGPASAHAPVWLPLLIRGRGIDMSNVIPFRYQGQPVRFNADGWINATEAAKHFGKKPAKWLELPSTKSYMAALARHLDKDVDVRKSDIKLVETSKVRGQAGTWLHPKLAVAFARWLSDDFAVWCDLHIDALLRGELTEKQQFDRACKALAAGQHVASISGKQLAEWRWRKPGLEQQVEHWREQLQLTLGLDAA